MLSLTRLQRVTLLRRLVTRPRHFAFWDAYELVTICKTPQTYPYRTGIQYMRARLVLYVLLYLTLFAGFKSARMERLLGRLSNFSRDGEV